MQKMTTTGSGQFYLWSVFSAGNLRKHSLGPFHQLTKQQQQTLLSLSPENLKRRLNTKRNMGRSLLFISTLLFVLTSKVSATVFVKSVLVDELKPSDTNAIEREGAKWLRDSDRRNLRRVPNYCGYWCEGMHSFKGVMHLLQLNSRISFIISRSGFEQASRVGNASCGSANVGAGAPTRTVCSNNEMYQKKHPSCASWQ